MVAAYPTGGVAAVPPGTGGGLGL